jgi:GDP-fucose protein O-fucosyltransferase
VTQRIPTKSTFQGGWNNIRMSMETAVTIAHATGRTLVMPPEQGMYLLHKDDKNQKNRFTFSDFFHFDSLETEHVGVEVISMTEFLEREVMAGNAINKHTGDPTFPPNNRTNWDGASREEAKQLDQWMRNFTENPLWEVDACVLGFPAKPGPASHLLKLGERVNQVPWKERIQMYTNNPVPVDAEPYDRLSEMMSHRHYVCTYDEYYQETKILHLMGDNDSGARLLVHFYEYLFFEDWTADLWTKRFVRDHIRYVDEIQCAAARIVKALRHKARYHGNQDGMFDTFHIRRGDFQYEDTRVESHVIYNNIQHLIPNGTTIYIATDEMDRNYFQIFREHYHVYFLHDFQELLLDLNSNFYGMMEQRIASRGRTFIGCFYSTFSGYINRMRGYHSQKEKGDGWEKGIINSWYYIPKDKMHFVRQYWPIVPPLWSREFPIAWRDINHQQ